MKYLKLFEGSNFSKKLYEEIDYYVYSKIKNKSIDISDRYIKILTDKFDKWEVEKAGEILGTEDRSSRILIIFYKTPIIFTIVRLEDDWFILKLRDKDKGYIWRCDQLEGLIELLDNICNSCQTTFSYEIFKNR